MLDFVHKTTSGLTPILRLNIAISPNAARDADRILLLLMVESVLMKGAVPALGITLEKMILLLFQNKKLCLMQVRPLSRNIYEIFVGAQIFGLFQ